MKPDSSDNARKPYASPQLRDYGTVAEITESQASSTGKVDGKIGYGGGGSGSTYANLKTSPN